VVRSISLPAVAAAAALALAALAVGAAGCGGGGGGGKMPAVVKMIPLAAAHAVVVGDVPALLKETTALIKKFYPYWTEESFAGFGAAMMIGSGDKIPVNFYDPADLRAHGFDPAGGLAAYFDDPDETTVVVKVTDEAAAEDVLEDMFHEMDREKDTKEGIKITHYKSEYRGVAYAFVDQFLLVLVYTKKFGDKDGPNLGEWAKRAFSVDETLVSSEPFKKAAGLLSAGTMAATYHFNPPAFFAARKKKLEKERDEVLKTEKAAGSTPTDVLTPGLAMKKAPDMAPVDPGYTPPPPDPYAPPPSYDPFGSSPYGARSSEDVKKEIKALADLQDDVDWVTGITASYGFGGDAVTWDLVIGLTAETADSARAAVPAAGPDTSKLRANALAFWRVSMSGDPLLDAVEPLLETASSSLGGMFGMMMGLPPDPKSLRSMAKEFEKYITGSAEVLLLMPPKEFKDEIGALRAVAVAQWSGTDKVGDSVDDWAASMAEGAGLEKEGKTEINGVAVHRYTLTVPGPKDKKMELPLAYAADGEYAIGAAGDGVMEEALGSAGPGKTMKNDGEFLHVAVFPSRVPMKGWPSGSYLAVTPAVMTFVRWIDRLEIVGKARAEGLHVHAELKIAKP